MTRRILSFTAAALFTLSVSAWAQESRPGQDTGPSGPPAGPAGGGAGVAGGGGGPSGVAAGSSVSSGGGGSASSSGGGSSFPTSAIGGSSWGEGRSSDSYRMAAPMRGPSRGDTAYASDDGQRAVPRGSGGSSPRGEGASSSGGGERTGRAVPRGEGGGGRISGRSDNVPMSADGPSERQRSPERGAVPSYSRPREGRTPVGSAVDRGDAPRPNIVVGSGYYYDPYFFGGGYYGSNRYRYGNYWFPGYGYGLGYFYDPFYFDPFYGGGFGYGGYGGGYGGYYGGGGGRYSQGRGYDTGSLRLRVNPRDAKVYVDGYFVGLVDSFDGVFQRLAIEAGSHRIEIRADGYEPAQFEVMVTPGETITYKGELKRLVQ